MDTNILSDLTKILQSRRDAQPESSYVASLYDQGLNRILEKVAEEATEVLLAAKDAVTDTGASAGTHKDEALIHEVADLWFHTLVMLVHLNQDPQWVLQALAERFGTSGHIEKRNRSVTGSEDAQ